MSCRPPAADRAGRRRVGAARRRRETLWSARQLGEVRRSAQCPWAREARFLRASIAATRRSGSAPSRWPQHPVLIVVALAGPAGKPATISGDGARARRRRTALSARAEERDANRRSTRRALFFDGQAWPAGEASEPHPGARGGGDGLYAAALAARASGARSRRHRERLDVIYAGSARERAGVRFEAESRPAAPTIRGERRKRLMARRRDLASARNGRDHVEEMHDEGGHESPARGLVSSTACSRPAPMLSGSGARPGEVLAPVLLARREAGLAMFSPMPAPSDGYVFVPAAVLFGSREPRRSARLSAHRPSTRSHPAYSCAREVTSATGSSSSRTCRRGAAARTPIAESRDALACAASRDWESSCADPPRVPPASASRSATSSGARQRPGLARMPWQRYPSTTRRRTPLARRRARAAGRLCDEHEWSARPRRRAAPSVGNGAGPDDSNHDVTYGRPLALAPTRSRRTRVAQPFGVDDSSGNVWEWVRSMRSPTKSLSRPAGTRRSLEPLRNREIGERTTRHPFHGVRSARLPWMHADHSC